MLPEAPARARPPRPIARSVVRRRALRVRADGIRDMRGHSGREGAAVRSPAQEVV
jgi:hypothetical protein